jgi:hypothetical protein
VEAAARHPSDRATLDFYMTWYAQPLRFLLSHESRS